MSLIYSSRNTIKLTSIPESYKVSKIHKARLSELHSMIVAYVLKSFKNTNKYKQSVTTALNVLTYSVYSNEMLPNNWSTAEPLSNIPQVSEDAMKAVLGDIYLEPTSIEWDVTESYSSIPASVNFDRLERTVEKPTFTSPAPTTINTSAASSNATPKQNLYIQPPTVPQFDISKPWLAFSDEFDSFTIYTTLPEIPTCQNEISVTTDVNMMTEKDLIKLFPNQIIHTRSAIMYEPIDKLKFNEDLGIMLKVSGFTEKQIQDNIIKYPHLYKLTRTVDGECFSFYSHIEINGELKGTLDVWESLSDSKQIPRNAEFIKEYVVRRYLLERDIKGIKHNYPMDGELLPFLTLFMPPEDYIRYGYKNVADIARQCVVSRVAYKQSRNPIIRRAKEINA